MHFHHLFICTIDCYSLDKSFCPKVPTRTSSSISMLSTDSLFFGGYFIMSTERYICVSEAIQWAETLPHPFTVPVVSFIYVGPPPSVLLEYRCFPSYSRSNIICVMLFMPLDFSRIYSNHVFTSSISFASCTGVSIQFGGMWLYIQGSSVLRRIF